MKNESKIKKINAYVIDHFNRKGYKSRGDFLDLLKLADGIIDKPALIDWFVIDPNCSLYQWYKHFFSYPRNEIMGEINRYLLDKQKSKTISLKRKCDRLEKKIWALEFAEKLRKNTKEAETKASYFDFQASVHEREADKCGRKASTHVSAVGHTKEASNLREKSKRIRAAARVSRV